MDGRPLAQCWGEEATRAARELLPEGVSITLQKDPKTADRDRPPGGWTLRIIVAGSAHYFCSLTVGVLTTVWERMRP